MWLLLAALLILLAISAALAVWSLVVARRIEAMVPAEGQYVDVPGARIHYVDLGPRDGTRPAIVMVHGLMGQLRNFTHSLADRLARDHRVIVVDRPGWGYSTLTGGRPGISAQADMIAALIAKLGLDRPLVVGHSMGGAVSLALGLAHPEAVRGLALIAPFTQPGGSLPEPFRALNVPVFLRPLIGWTLAVPMGMRSGAIKTGQVFAPDSPPPDFATRAGAALSMRPRSFRSGAFEVGIALFEIGPIAARYPELKVPLTILYGRQDALLDPALHGEHTAAQIPGATVELVEGGHMLLITHAEITEAWLRRALA